MLEKTKLTVRKTKLILLENKIPDVSGLATKTALTAVENKIPDVSSLVKKTNYDTKISELEKKLTDHNHDKYITTPEFNTLAADVFNARLAQANLITKTDFDAKLSSLNRKITSNKTKHLLVENELKKFNLGYFIGKSHFDEDGAQHYLVFQPILRYVTLNSNWITKWKSKGLSNESFEVVYKTDNTLSPSANYYGDRVRLRFTGSVLQQKTVTYSQKKVVNFYVVYEIINFHGIDSYPTLANAVFGAVKLIQNADIYKYRYFVYGIGLDGHGSFSHPNGGIGKNVIIFGVNMNSSTKIGKKNKGI